MAEGITITVTGTSTARQKAERATMHIRVSSEAESQSEVAHNVTITSQELQDLFEALAKGRDHDSIPSAVHLSQWTMGGLSTWSYQPWTAEDEQPKPRIYTATTTFESTFKDFEQLGKVATFMLAKPFVSVDRVVWDLTDKTRASLGKKTRVGAVEDAIAKASDYAMALKQTKIEAIEVSDNQFPSAPPPQLHMAMRRTAVPAQEQELNLTPETINVESSVVVKFKAT